MAEENTQQPGAAAHGSEPTMPIPQLPSQPTPEQPSTQSASPIQPWSAADVAESTRIDPAQQADQSVPGPQPTQTWPGATGAPPYPPPGAPYAPTGGYAQLGASYAPPGSAPSFYPPPPQGPNSGSYPPPGQGYPSGPYTGYYAPGTFQAPPAAPVKNRRSLMVLVAAVVLALAVGVGGYVAASSRFGAVQTPTVQVPSSGTVPSASDEPSTRSKAVTTAEATGVVLIEGETGSGTAYGTGMVLTADGKVLTNYHVVAGTTKLAVTIASSGDTYVATVLGFDQSRDVALLQLKDASGLATVTIDHDAVTVGSEVAAVGNANGGMKLVKSAGSVTATDQELTVNSDSPWGNTEDLSGLVATDAGAVPGDSGGPMFDAQTEVLGMTTAGSTKEHVSYAVPIATALAVVDQIETGQDAGTVRVGPAGYLGVRVADASYTGVGGSTVTGVVSGSPAAKAGISAGSRLTKIGQTAITENTNVAAVIRAIEPGEKVTVSWVTSSGKSMHATVTAGSSPVN